MTTPDDYDHDLQQLAILADLRRRAEAAHIEAETRFVDRVAADLDAGNLSEADLEIVFAQFFPDAAPGYNNRWNDRVDIRAKRLIARAHHLHRFLPKDDGSWSGSWPLGDNDTMPPHGQSVVYVLFDRANTPCYLGSTDRLRVRLRQHQYDNKQIAYWTAYPCKGREAAYQLEERLLSEHKPYLNRKISR